MLTEERRQQILQLLDAQQVIKSQELIERLDASESTIRRDLQELEDEGLLERVHGGAKRIIQLGQEYNMQEKSIKNIQEKKKIAKYAASLLREGDIIYLDAGTTTYEMIPYLPTFELKVITNSVDHAVALTERGIDTIVLGGALKASTRAILGSSALEQLANYRFNKTFLGMNAAHLEFGYSTPDPEEAVLKRLASEHAAETFFLVDASKINNVSFTKVAAIDSGTLITTTLTPALHQAYIEKTKLKEIE